MRDKKIIQTSALNVIVNVVIALIKIVIGLVASSIAIVSEGIHNFADAANSLLTIVGAKLATKHPDKKHPFGYGRIEYLTSLVVGLLVIYSGLEILKDSIKLISNPEDMNVSYLSLIIICVTAVVKFILGNYTIKVGEGVDASSLIAVGQECRNDSYASIITLLSTLIFLIFGLSLDAYAGLITSLLIAHTGYEIVSDTIHELLGRPGDSELAQKLYAEIRATKGILNAADMMLHNYGPNAYSGSVNIEMDHNKTVGDIYKTIHALQLRIMHEYKVTMVFGIYAVDNDSEKSKKLRKEVAHFIKGYEHVNSYHAIYIESKTNKIYCDLVVDYDLKDWDKLEKEFKSYMVDLYPNKQIELVIETEFV